MCVGLLCSVVVQLDLEAEAGEWVSCDLNDLAHLAELIRIRRRPQ